MTTGANFKVIDGRVQWWLSLISGDELITQDHEHRMHARQGTYRLYDQYGNPFAITLSSEISKIERNMRLVSETKECSLQDARINDSIVDPNSIVEEETKLTFNYQLVKADGGILQQSFST